MPAALLLILRPLLIWIVQIVVTTIIADIVASFLKQIVSGVAAHYGISEDDSKIVVTNQIIDLAATLGIGTGVLYSKLGIKAADYLGLKAAGTVTRKLSTAAAAKVGVKNAAPLAATEAKGILATVLKGETIWKGILFVMLLQQVGDWFIFGRPQLQGYIDAVFGKGAVELPTANDAPPPFSKGTWLDYYTGLENAGIVGIEGGAVAATLIYSRDQLVQLVWWGYSQLLKKGASPTETAVKKYIQANLRFKDTPVAAAIVKSTTSQPVTQAVVKTAPTQIQVYTGVVASGTLGAPAEFTARADDMIDDSNELKASAKNNLAAFLATLPGRYAYEIGIVNTIKTKGGFTQKGSPVQVLTGYTTGGKPKYKTIYNKFAQLVLTVTDDNGKVVKLATINLGPVNATSYQPTPIDLQTIQKAITPELFTNSLSSVTAIVAQQNIAVSPTAPSNPNPPAQNAVPYLTFTVNGTTPLKIPLDGTVFRAVGDSNGDAVYKRTGATITTIAVPQYTAATRFTDTDTGITYEVGQASTNPHNVVFLDTTYSGLATKRQSAYDVYRSQTGQEPLSLPEFNMADLQTVLAHTGGVLPSTDSSDAAPLLGQDATTLAAFYSANGKSLPSTADRAPLYEKLGLGPASTYAGTAEQNNRLLAALKTAGGGTL